MKKNKIGKYNGEYGAVRKNGKFKTGKSCMVQWKVENDAVGFIDSNRQKFKRKIT